MCSSTVNDSNSIASRRALIASIACCTDPCGQVKVTSVRPVAAADTF